LPQPPGERLAALLRLAAHPLLLPSSSAAARLHARWPATACALLLAPALPLTANDQPLYTSQPYECTFRDYTPSIGLLYGGGFGGSALSSALRTPAFLTTQDMYGSRSPRRRLPPGMMRATATHHFVPTLSLSAAGDVFAAGSSSSWPYGMASNSLDLAARSRESSIRYVRNVAIRGMQQRQLLQMAMRRHGRAARLRLFRSYRSGELPDTLSVRVSSFLRPLAGVV
ncbi:hypothetical protein Agub_g6699, partial [Astrephomene gubernaculifera]